MASFFHDESRLNEFARRAQEQSEQQHKALSGPDACLVDVLEWPPSKYAFFNLSDFFFPFFRKFSGRTRVLKKEKAEVFFF